MDIQIQKIDDLLKGYINGPVLDQVVSRLTAPGENYGSLMLKIDIRYKDGDEVRTLHTVAKCIPPNKELQDIFDIQTTFKNEVAWYTIVIPTLLEFQEEQGVHEPVDFFMKIYGARISLDPTSDVVDDDAVILCENLITKGYKNVDRTVGFTLEDSQQILRKLAAFHALLMGLRIKKPDEFEQKVNKYLQGTVGKPPLEHIIDFLKEYSETSAFKERIQNVLENLSDDIGETWASAIHHDFWVNNMMLKSEEGKPPNVIILDLQTCNYGSVVDDLLFFLVTSVQTDILREHFDELTQLYYHELLGRLKSLGVDTISFSQDSFERELKARAPGQFAHALFFIGIVMAEKGKGTDLSQEGSDPANALKIMFGNLSEKCKERYTFLVHEFARRNWI